jgi:hypothetical protein
MMHQFAITTTIPTSNGSFQWFCFETSLSIEQVYAALRDDGVVFGTRLRTIKHKDGTVIVRGREPLVLARAGVATVVPMTLKSLERGEGAHHAEALAI